MATLVNRRLWWAVDGRSVPVRVLSQDLESVTCEVLCDNGGRHTAPSYDLYLSEEIADDARRLLSRHGGAPDA